MKQIHAIYDLLKMAPTSANMQSARIVGPSPPRRGKTRRAPAIESNRAQDHDRACRCDHRPTISLPRTATVVFPHTDARSWFVSDEAAREPGCVPQLLAPGAYLMLAHARSASTAGRLSGFRQRRGGRGVFFRRPAPPPQQFHLRDRLWRPGEHLRPQSAPRIRPVQPHRLIASA